MMQEKEKERLRLANRQELFCKGGSGESDSVG